MAIYMVSHSLGKLPYLVDIAFKGTPNKPSTLNILLFLDGGSLGLRLQPLEALNDHSPRQSHFGPALPNAFFVFSGVTKSDPSFSQGEKD